METDNIKLATLVGSTMHKVEQLSQLYVELKGADGDPVIEAGFIDVASQSLSGGIKIIKNKLSRYEHSVDSMWTCFKNQEPSFKKTQASRMLSLIGQIRKNLQTLETTKLPIHMTDKESCHVGIGYYKHTDTQAKATRRENYNPVLVLWGYQNV